MKKISVFLTVMIGFVIFGQDVYAACGSGVYVEDVSICLAAGGSGSNVAGTAYADDSVLVLDNYNGGSIAFWDGLGATIATIKLVGDNYITNIDGYGLSILADGVDFIGDGTLTIKALRPIVTPEFYSSLGVTYNPFYNASVTTITIKAGGNAVIENENDENDIVHDNEVIEKEQDLDFNSIVLFGSMGISALLLIVIIILLVKNNNYKKMV